MGHRYLDQGEAITEIALLALPIRPRRDSASLKRIHNLTFPPLNRVRVKVSRKNSEKRRKTHIPNFVNREMPLQNLYI